MTNKALHRAIRSLNLSAIKTAVAPQGKVFVARYIQGDREKDSLNSEWRPLRTDEEIQAEHPGKEILLYNFCIPEIPANNE